MKKNNNLTSLTIFFPFFNDEGTVKKQISDAFVYGKQVCNNLEVIAIHGGPSKDQTYQEINRMKKEYPQLIVINKKNNNDGYAVIKTGIKQASKKWVFYTDGDAQYHLKNDLKRLVKKQVQTNSDVVNGYKIKRSDNFLRVFLGRVYALICQLVFSLPIRDVDCDFRLIRKCYLNKISLEFNNSSILPEMIKKLQIAGAKISEIPVSHYPRIYGKSNYNILKLIKEKIISGYKLFFHLKSYAKSL